ncbi:MAG: hypothetical protein JWQ27_1127 [Ferruginibacter sp.]|nr:hypothetical protein [Ferruginibacter sp.]
MNRALIFLFFVCAAVTGKAQLNHFIYLQTDNKQSFYVRMNDKLYSSSSAGYLIIPKLQSGDYTLSIGFPKNEWPLQTIPVSVKTADAGYILKNFAEKGWGLFNMQTLEVAMNTGFAGTNPTVKTENKTDVFSNVLADVVNTPSLKEVNQPAAPVVTVPVKPVVEDKPVITAKEKISVLATTKEENGRAVIYIDQMADGTDTIRLFIPYEKTMPVTEIIPQVIKEPVPDTVVIRDLVRTPPVENKEDKKFLNIELPNPNSDSTKLTSPVVVPPVETALAPVKTEAKKETIAALTINSDCKAMATEEDFLKTRKKMAAEDSDDDMISVARKLFKAKCYSTEQVKNLGLLFLKEDGRYRFFDAAYPRIHDTQNFPALESQFTEEYYQTRFRAMLRN